MPYRRVKYQPTDPEKDLFEINFDNKSMKFRPLQMFSGNVYLDITEPMKLLGIYFEIKGEIKIHPKGAKTANRWGTSHQKIYKEGGYIISNGVREKEMPRGSYEIPFGYFLPSKLPNSLVNNFATVQYYCTFLMTSIRKGIDGKVKKKKRTVFNKVRVPFEIITTLDLNPLFSTRVPEEVVLHQNVSSWFHSYGYLDMSLHLNRTGFVSGETIDFRVSIRNGTNETLKVKVKLNQEMVYKIFSKVCLARTKVIRREELLNSKDSPLEVHENNLGYIWKDTLDIPNEDLMATNLGWNGQIIELNYIFRVEVPHPRRKYPFSLKIPIILGTVPIQIAEPIKHQHIAINEDLAD